MTTAGINIPLTTYRILFREPAQTNKQDFLRTLEAGITTMILSAVVEKESYLLLKRKTMHPKRLKKFFISMKTLTERPEIGFFSMGNCSNSTSFATSSVTLSARGALGLLRWQECYAFLSKNLRALLQYQIKVQVEYNSWSVIKSNVHQCWNSQ